MAQRRSLRPPPSVPAIVRNRQTGQDENCVYLTSPSAPVAAVILPRDGYQAPRDIGESPLPKKGKPRIL